MQVSVEKVSNILLKLTIELPWENLQDQEDSRFNDLVKKAKLPGFRPGKVPMSVLKKRFGASVRQEALADLMQNAYPKALKEKDIQPVGYPQFDAPDLEEGKQIRLIAQIETFPDIEVTALEGVEIEQVTSTVTDADIEEALKRLQERNKSWQAVERASAKDDQITFDFAGKKDGEALPQATAEDFELVLGSGEMIPGFEDNLVGCKAGDEKVFEVVFPEDYHASDLAGQPVEFTCTIKAVKEPTLPELDEDFAKTLDVEGGIDALRKEIRENMEADLELVLKDKAKRRAFDKLLSLNNEIEVPQALVKGEIEGLKREAQQRFLQMTGQQHNHSAPMPDLPDELFKGEAEKRAKLSILVRELEKQFSIEIEDAAIDQRLRLTLKSYDYGDDMVGQFLQNKQYRDHIRGMLMEEQVVERLLADAKVTEKSLAYADAIKPEEPKQQQDQATEAPAEEE